MIETAFGLSVRGRYHKENRIPNQDYFKIYNNKKYNIAVVCDGLGSKSKSHFASKYLANIVVNALKKSLKADKFNIYEIFLKIQKVYLSKISKFGLKEADTTLQVIINTENKILILKCGDGTISITSDHTLVIDEDEDNFINETISFGSSTYKNWIIKNISKDPNLKYKMFICTDGVSSKIIENKQNEFIERIIKLNKKELKKVLSNWVVTPSDDDKTIVIIK